MTTDAIQWMDEVLRRKDELIGTTQEFLRIKSVRDEATARDGAPFGEGIQKALQFALRVCEEAGMTTKDVDGYAGHAEFGQGEELIGVLSHVDVVPEGDGWSTPPFAAEIVDGKIIARGALDDKGPTMAAIFAAKLVKELNLPLTKRVRLIFGADEESSWQCVKTYFQREEMPAMGFTPDADFPLIYAEKGLTHLVFRQTSEAYASEKGKPNGETVVDAKLVKLEAGLRMNMVPDRATAVLQAEGVSPDELTRRYRAFLAVAGRPGDVRIEGGKVVLSFEGISVHGMDPTKGVNAGTELIRFLADLTLDERAAKFVAFTTTYLYRQHFGEAFGIAGTDDEMGPLTLNTGVIQYDAAGDIRFDVNIRYPHGHAYDEWQHKLAGILREEWYELEVIEHLPPHRVEPTHPLVTTLQRVYTEQTSQEANLIAIGGATYSRSLDVGVAFGPLFPHRTDCAHQRDEHIHIEDLLKATALYAQAIYELAK